MVLGMSMTDIILSRRDSPRARASRGHGGNQAHRFNTAFTYDRIHDPLKSHVCRLYKTEDIKKAQEIDVDGGERELLSTVVARRRSMES